MSLNNEVNMNDINNEIKRLDPSVIETAKKFTSATLHEAFKKGGAIDRSIKPIDTGLVICGSAFTVSCAAGDNLGLHIALDLAEPGDVLVAETNGSADFGYWGEIMAAAAIQKGISGIVIDGCVRDYAQIRKLKFPIFSKGLCIRGTNKNLFYSINYPIVVGNVLINPGDLILGDEDGVVVIDQDQISEVIERAIEREKKEKLIIEGLNEGKSLRELLVSGGFIPK